MSGFAREVRWAIRSFSRTPAFTAVAFLCLCLGIGANTAVYSVVQAVLIQRLPFDEPDRIVSVWATWSSQGAGTTRFFLTPQQFVELRERNVSLAQLSAWRVESTSMEGDEYPEEVTRSRISAESFELLGLEPVVGRTFGPLEDHDGSRVALINERIWRRRFGGVSTILNATITIDGDEHLIIGVLPDDTAVPTGADLWTPLGVDDITGDARLAGSLTVLGRLRPGVTPEWARQDLHSVASSVASALPERNTGLDFDLARWQTILSENVRTGLLVLFAAVGFLLAIAVSNVVNLLLVRAQVERRSLAMRAALGATRSRLVRETLTANMVLVLAGGGGGVVVAYLALPALLALQPDSLSPFREVTIDGTVLVFTLMVSLLTALFVTVSSTMRTIKADTAAVLRTGSRSGMARSGRRVHSGLVVTEVATALILSIGATLMIRSYAAVQRVDPGFTSDDVLIVRAGVPPSRNALHDTRVAFFSEALDAVRSVPGVRHAGAAHVLPITDVLWGIGFNVEGQRPATPAARHVAFFRLVTPGYHEAMEMRLLEGRYFDRTDRTDSPPVTIVSQSLAEQYWPAENAVGKRIKRGTYDDPGEPWRTVVGVVADVRDSALAGQARPAIYFNYSQHRRAYAARMVFAIKTDMDPLAVAPAVERAIRQIDGATLVYDVATFNSLLANSISRDRFNAVLLGVFAGLGIILAAAGIYGAVSYTVAQRTGEFGLRVALGANNGHVLSQVVLGGCKLAAVGIAIGALGATLLTRSIQSLLVGIEPVDPVSYAAMSALLLTVTIAATWIPARRATQVDPAEAFRYDG